MQLLNLCAISSLAILTTLLGATPSQGLSTHAQVSRAHHNIALTRRAPRSSTRRCKAKDTSSSAEKPEKTEKAKPKDGKPKPPGGNRGPRGGPKAGLAWPNGDDPALSKYRPHKGTPLYTWSPFLPGSCKRLGFNCMPMLWGPKQNADFRRLVKPGYANTALGFNEPNQHGQSDINPQYGAQLWKEYLQPLAYQGYRLVSPATTSAPSGMTWMKQFFAACGGCTVDVVAVHWYDVSANDFKAYVNRFHDAFGRNIWVTEYACQNFNGGPQCSRDETWGFHQNVVGWMNGVSWIEHYFPFGVMHQMQGVNSFNQLMSGNGGPTDLGHMYFS